MRIDNSIVVFVVHPKTGIYCRFAFPNRLTMHQAAAEAMLSFGLADNDSKPWTLRDELEPQVFPFDANITALMENGLYTIFEHEPVE